MSGDFLDVQNWVDKFMDNHMPVVDDDGAGVFVALIFGILAAVFLPYFMIESVGVRVTLAVSELLLMVVFGEVYYYLNLKAAARIGVTKVSMSEVFLTKFGGSFIMLFFCLVWVILTFLVLILVGFALALIGGLLYALWLLFSSCGYQILITIGSVSFIVGGALVYTWINKKLGEKMLNDHAKKQGGKK